MTKNKITEKHFLLCASDIAGEIRQQLNKFYNAKLLNGAPFISFVNSNQADLKQEHKVDAYAKSIAFSMFKEKYPAFLAAAYIYIENTTLYTSDNPNCSIIFDPVDGSLCADLHIADPCIMFAFTPQGGQIRFKGVDHKIGHEVVKKWNL